jgi:predicted PurR-regulated permease PerM
MIGLLVLVVGAIYLAVLVFVTRAAYRWASRKGLPKSRRILTVAGGFLLVYLPVFWDHIPTLIMHKYYCEKEAGFWVYKTLEQWKTENPGVIEGLVSYNKNPGGFNVVWPS